MSALSESLRLLTKNERFAQIAQRKWAIVSESLIFEQKTKKQLGNWLTKIILIC